MEKLCTCTTKNNIIISKRANDLLLKDQECIKEKANEELQSEESDASVPL